MSAMDRKRMAKEKCGRRSGTLRIIILTMVYQLKQIAVRLCNWVARKGIPPTRPKDVE